MFCSTTILFVGLEQHGQLMIFNMVSAFPLLAVHTSGINRIVLLHLDLD